MNFLLNYHYKYQLSELDNMIPFEREIYIALLQQQLEQEKLELQKANAR